MKKINKILWRIAFVIVFLMISLVVYHSLQQQKTKDDKKEDPDKDFNGTSNASRHLYDLYNYAHYSRVRNFDTHKYPLLKQSHPTTIELNAGDVLFIPKTWWHWVRSSKNTLAMNYWWKNKDNNTTTIKNQPFQILKETNNKQRMISSYPNISIEEITGKDYSSNINSSYFSSFKDINQPFVFRNGASTISILSEEFFQTYFPESVQVYYENLDSMKYMKLKDFLSLRPPNTYVITLAAFDKENLAIKQKMFSEAITHPAWIQSVPITIENTNFWFNLSEIDTGLHYDDENGLLRVLHGQKTVTLFPPEDLPYLYSYPRQPLWLQSEIENLHFNVYKISLQNQKSINNPLLSLHSCQFLYESFRNANKSLLNVVDLIYKRFRSNQVLYGIKCDIKTGKIRWEFYWYLLKKHMNQGGMRNDMRPIMVYPGLQRYNQGKNHFYNFTSDKFSDIDEKNLVIHSIDAIDNAFPIQPNFSLYYHDSQFDSKEKQMQDQKQVKQLGFPFYGLMYQKLPRNQSFLQYRYIVNSMRDTLINLPTILLRLKIPLEYEAKIREQLGTYSYASEIGIWNKMNRNICIQWYGISDFHFLQFLQIYNWPKHLISWYQQHQKDLMHMNKEISINYYIENTTMKDPNWTVTRTSLFGII